LYFIFIFIFFQGGSINGAVSHCFPLSLNNNAVALPGVDGILDAYHKAFYQVALAGTLSCYTH
jgi:hypothetical protein